MRFGGCSKVRDRLGVIVVSTIGDCVEGSFSDSEGDVLIPEFYCQCVSAYGAHPVTSRHVVLALRKNASPNGGDR